MATVRMPQPAPGRTSPANDNNLPCQKKHKNYLYRNTYDIPDNHDLMGNDIKNQRILFQPRRNPMATLRYSSCGIFTGDMDGRRKCRRTKKRNPKTENPLRIKFVIATYQAMPQSNPQSIMGGSVCPKDRRWSLLPTVN